MIKAYKVHLNDLPEFLKHVNYKDSEGVSVATDIIRERKIFTVVVQQLGISTYTQLQIDEKIKSLISL